MENKTKQEIISFYEEKHKEIEKQINELKYIKEYLQEQIEVLEREINENPF